MLSENLLGKEIIQVVTAVIRWIGDGDPTSRRLIEELLVGAEGRASTLRDLLSGSGPPRAPGRDS